MPKNKKPAPLKLYTAFCQDANGLGTIWIDHTIQAKDPEAAEIRAQKKCAKAWGYELADVHVLGIAEGAVNILRWKDISESSPLVP